MVGGITTAADFGTADFGSWDRPLGKPRSRQISAKDCLLTRWSDSLRREAGENGPRADVAPIRYGCELTARAVHKETSSIAQSPPRFATLTLSAFSDNASLNQMSIISSVPIGSTLSHICSQISFERLCWLW